MLCRLTPDWVQGEKAASQPDELIDFAHLKARQGLSQLELEDEVATDLQRATGLASTEGADAGRLNRVLQLSGAGMPLKIRIFVNQDDSQTCPQMISHPMTSVHVHQWLLARRVQLQGASTKCCSSQGLGTAHNIWISNAERLHVCP